MPLRRAPTHRRGGSQNYVVDHAHLVDLIIRRCTTCSLAYHMEVAARFLAQEEFEQADVDAVLTLLEAKVRSRNERRSQPPKWHEAAPTAICMECGQSFDRHPADEDWDELTVLCDGSRVRLVGA